MRQLLPSTQTTCVQWNLVIFQLFDADNPVNVNSGRYMFTTEGHVLPLAPWLRHQTREDDLFQETNTESHINISLAGVRTIILNLSEEEVSSS